MNEDEKGVCDKLLKEILASDCLARSTAIGQYETFLRAVRLRMDIEYAAAQPTGK